MSGFHIWTIGCQMNVADSRRLAESLQRYGLEVADGPHAADVVVLYSCVVRQQAEDRVHGQLQALRQMKAARPEMKVVVAGCVSDIPDWRKRYPFVDLIAEPGQDLTVRERLIDLLDLSERYRFDPEGLNSHERSALRAQADAWLREHPSEARMTGGRGAG